MARIGMANRKTVILSLILLQLFFLFPFVTFDYITAYRNCLKY